MHKHHPKYQRYHIRTKTTPNIIPHPHRFRVKVKRLGLAKLLLKELLHYRGNKEVVLSRPCVYGVFSGPFGGFAPRERLCVGCLRCTVQYPDMVSVSHHPEHARQGDDYFTYEYLDTVIYEAESGRVPVKGAGYRGKFGGKGWDGMWTDMSEIVRPTRDGIHEREFISTEVDIGQKLPFLKFDENQQLIEEPPKTISIPLPLLFDTPPSCQLSHTNLLHIIAQAASEMQTFAVLPFDSIEKFSLKWPHVIPLLAASDFEAFRRMGFDPAMIEINGWSEEFFLKVRSFFPEAVPIVRTSFETDLLACYQLGARVFHLTADYHGKSESGRFVLDLIRDVHQEFVKAGCRSEVTFIGSGGMIAAEHLAKGIICGLDAVALDTPILAALQGRFEGTCSDPHRSHFYVSPEITVAWGKQRLKNLGASWRSQLLEILGAMGLREVRRLRGEIGRAMFQKDLENEAFAGITGYEPR